MLPVVNASVEMQIPATPRKTLLKLVLIMYASVEVEIVVQVQAKPKLPIVMPQITSANAQPP